MEEFMILSYNKEAVNDDILFSVDFIYPGAMELNILRR